MHYKQLNYDSYDEYLNGEEWNQIRDIMYHSGGAYHCRICHKRQELRLHKRSYFQLTPAFFRQLLKNNPRLFKKFLVYLCPRCNTLVHFYDGRKMKKKVPLDYIFLWDREQRIYRRPDMVFMRSVRTVVRAVKWYKESYWIRRRVKRKRY